MLRRGDVEADTNLIEPALSWERRDAPRAPVTEGRVSGMNVLVTCAGRRGYLIRSFQTAVGDRGSVFAADAAPEAPALQAADEAFVVPRVEDSDYVERLLEICDERSVDLLISLNDLELPLIAWNRDRFQAIGTVPVISSPEIVRICSDKWATVRFLRAHGIRDAGDLPAPA